MKPEEARALAASNLESSLVQEATAEILRVEDNMARAIAADGVIKHLEIVKAAAEQAAVDELHQSLFDDTDK